MFNRRHLIYRLLGLVSAVLIVDLAGAQTDLTSSLTFWQDGDPGERLNLRGRVIDQAGKPVSGAIVALRQADGSTTYIPRYSGALITDERGTFSLDSAVPGQYSSAKHIHVRVTHDAFESLHTEILFKGDPNIDLGAPDSVEVVLETVQEGGEQRSIGGVELVLKAR